VLPCDASTFARTPACRPAPFGGFQTRNLTDAQRKNLRRCEGSHTPTSRFALIQSLQALLGFDQTGDFE
jgi:hypothetical protein